jgi:hypothetical protein
VERELMPKSSSLLFSIREHQVLIIPFNQYRGLEADQKVIAIHGCYAMTATTALTAQNTLGVVDIHYTPPEFIRKLIDACISDIGVDVVKTGIVTSEICLIIFNDIENTHLKHSDFSKGCWPPLKRSGQ